MTGNTLSHLLLFSVCTLMHGCGRVGTCAVEGADITQAPELEIFLTGVNHLPDNQKGCASHETLDAIRQRANILDQSRIMVATTGGSCKSGWSLTGNGRILQQTFADSYSKVEHDQYNITVGTKWRIENSTFVRFGQAGGQSSGFMYALLTDGTHRLPTYVVRFSFYPELRKEHIRDVVDYAMVRWSRREMAPLIVGDFNLRPAEVPDYVDFQGLWEIDGRARWLTQDVACTDHPKQPKPMLFVHPGDLMNVISSPANAFQCGTGIMRPKVVFYDQQGTRDDTPAHPRAAMEVSGNGHNVVAMKLYKELREPSETCRNSRPHRFKLRLSNVDDDAYVWLGPATDRAFAVCSASFATGGSAECDLTDVIRHSAQHDYGSFVLKFGNGGGFASSGRAELILETPAGPEAIWSKDKASLTRHTGWFYRAEFMLNAFNGRFHLVSENECRNVTDCPW